MAHLLVVEDDEFFGQAIQCVIEACGHEVTLKENGREAIAVLKERAFDCVLSDVQMPVLGGLELLKWCTENHPIPFILMTGHSDAVNTQSALASGAIDLLLKPFSETEVERALLVALNEPAKKPLAQLCRIPSETLTQQGSLDFNVYQKKDGEYLKIASRGEEARHISRLTTYFYVEREHVSTLIPINILLTKAMVSAPVIELERKLCFLRRTGEILQSQIQIEGLNAAALQSSKEYTECLLEAIEDQTVIQLLGALDQTADFLYVHALGVACVGGMIAKSLNVIPSDLAKIVFSSFFHDIGKLKLPADLITQAKPFLTATQRATVETHVRLGSDLLGASGAIEAEITKIVLQHHENGEGTGYPNKLKSPQIHPLARIVRVADLFCNHALPNPNSLGMPAKAALRQMEDEVGLDRESFQALKYLVAL